MTTEHLIAFNIFLFVSMLSPGLALLMVARQTLEQGFSVGFKTGIGLGTMAAFWTMCALIGLGAAFALFPFAYSAVRLIGGTGAFVFCLFDLEECFTDCQSASHPFQQSDSSWAYDKRHEP